MKTEHFQLCGPCWVFQICWNVEYSTLIASSSRIWNSSVGVPSPPLALFVVKFPKAYFISHSMMSGCRWVTTPLWLFRNKDHFFYSSSVYSCHLFLISSTSLQFSSVTQSCPTLCNPMNRSTPGLSVHHQLPEFTQTHIHRVSDVIQPSHPLLSPSPPAPNPSQYQSLFQWVN